MTATTECKLSDKKCKPCEGNTPALSPTEIQTKLKLIDPTWTTNTDSTQISRNMAFKNYYQTMAFVNATAWISHAENHHPDLEVSYNHCVIHYTTHAIKGLSENDFICAAKIDALLGA